MINTKTIESIIYKFAIIIVNWGNEEDTEECLLSINDFIKYTNFFVVLVNNNTKDCSESVRKLNLSYEIFIIENSKNLGFARANNIGIVFAQKHKPDYIILLNNDVVLVNDDLLMSVKLLEKSENYGVLGLVNYYYNSPETIWQIGTQINYSNGNKKIIKSLPKEKNDILECNSVPGSSFVIKSSLLKEIGLLDENYFLYWEETDFCYRVIQKGYKVGSNLNSKVLHKKNKRNKSALHTYFMLRNQLYHFSGKQSNFILVLIKSIVKFFIIASLNQFQGADKNYYAFYLALKDFFTQKFEKGSFDKLIK